MDRIRALSFDCYGSLVDWEAGVRAYIGALLVRPSTSPVARPDIDVWLTKWQQIRRQMMRPYRPWRELLVRSHDATLQFFGLEAFVDEGPAMVRQIAALEPRAGAKKVLRRLARRYRLAIISNPDRQALAEVLGRLQAPFSSVVAAEDVKRYKPDGKLFELALQRLGLTPPELLHVSTSPDEDVQPAQAAGLRTALVGTGAADLTVPSLEALAEALQV